MKDEEEKQLEPKRILTGKDIQKSLKAKISKCNLDTDALLDFINEGITTLYLGYDLSFSQKMYDALFPQGQYRFEIPEEIDKICTVHLFDPVTRETIKVKEQGNDNFFKCNPLIETKECGAPCTYTKVGCDLYFECPTDKSYNIIFRYYPCPSEITSLDDPIDLPYKYRLLLTMAVRACIDEGNDDRDLALETRSRLNNLFIRMNRDQNSSNTCEVKTKWGYHQ